MMLWEAQLVGEGLIAVVLFACFLSICVAKDQMYQTCSPSSCGDIWNISYPFRLQGDPSCGYPEYELICENNRTMVNLYSGKYYVAEINYQNYAIRVVDPGLKKGNCLISSPLHSIDAYHTYGFPYDLPYQWKTRNNLGPSELKYSYSTIVLINCEQSISQDNYIPIIPCNIRGYSSSSRTYAYAVVGDYASAGDISNSCTIGTYMVIQPLKELPEPCNRSMSDLQDSLLLGVQFSFLDDFCNRHCQRKGQFCSNVNVTENTFQCLKTEKNSRWKSIKDYLLLPFIRGLLYRHTLTLRGLQNEYFNCNPYFYRRTCKN